MAIEHTLHNVEAVHNDASQGRSSAVRLDAAVAARYAAGGALCPPARQTLQ